MTATIPAEVVLDASAALRGYLRPEGTAGELVNELALGRAAAHVPDLFVSEVANALRVRIDAERWPLADASYALDVLLQWPVSIQPSRPLALAAIGIAGELGISAYDAFYAVLSAQLGLPLVTADRRLAAAVPNGVLVA